MSPRPSASRPCSACVAASSFLPANRSAMMPAYGPMTRAGPNCSAMATPTAAASSFVSSVRISQSWAVRFIQAPMFDTIAPANQMR